MSPRSRLIACFIAAGVVVVANTVVANFVLPDAPQVALLSLKPISAGAILSRQDVKATLVYGTRWQSGRSLLGAIGLRLRQAVPSGHLIMPEDLDEPTVLATSAQRCDTPLPLPSGADFCIDRVVQGDASAAAPDFWTAG